jgi:hypothetical protein
MLSTGKWSVVKYLAAIGRAATAMAGLRPADVAL